MAALIHQAPSDPDTRLLLLSQGVGCILRVSCVTPLLGPCLGFLGVGIASAVAGQVSVKTRRVLEQGPAALDGFRPSRLLEDAPLNELLLDATLGVTLFKLLGGSYRGVMPSNLQHPGKHLLQLADLHALA